MGKNLANLSIARAKLRELGRREGLEGRKVLQVQRVLVQPATLPT